MTDTEEHPPLPESPASERNKAPILAALTGVLPAHGRVLEVASGLGQHVVHFAAALPNLDWQPTEANLDLIPIVDRRVAISGLSNVYPTIALDVVSHDWASTIARDINVVYTANLLHISPIEVSQALFERARSICDTVIVYGPFRIKGAQVSPENARFDESLRERDARWGIRDLEWVAEMAMAAQFDLMQVIEMPANNRLLVFR